ncbi:hypothetical protein AGDE_11029 [Angomonas deanei]|nr:hypothetical protein AGDE_11029 [Angomonas deanei]|eukprot:EPY26913.1 hypothetical protein AGDE_11029 [Angomonas deanei]
MSLLQYTMGKEPALDVTNRAFQPKRFVRKTLTDVSHEMLEGELVEEVRSAGDEAGESLKQLLRDNLGTFIESKDAMDTVFETDHALFTGEALEDIMEEFEDAEEGCQTIVKPILDSYYDVQQSRRSQDILGKLFNILSVPGVLYQSCGVRVALSKVLPKLTHETEEEPDTETPEKEQKKVASPATDTDEEEEEEEDEEDSDFSQSEKVNAPRGALEEVGSKNPADDYILNPGEELFYFYDIPLVRLRNKNAQRNRVEEESNFEAATLSFRRAMLYMDERYDLEKGLVKDANSDDNDDSDGTVSRFTYNFALALLRAGLYLNDQLAVELTNTSAADTVFIEDTLSMMMDVSEYTTKLHHFCQVLLPTFEHRNEGAMHGLRSRLGENMDHGSFNTPPLGSSSTYREDSEYGTPLTGGSGKTYRAGPTLKHPAQYMIGIIKNEYTKLMTASAVRVSREATAWKEKVIPKGDGQTGGAGDDKDLVGGGMASLNGGNFSFSDEMMSSFLGGGMFKDSFTNSTFAFKKGDAVAGKSGSGNGNDKDDDDFDHSLSFSYDNIVVGGFTSEMRSSSAAAGGVERYAEDVLEAFRTPEFKNATYTSFKIGSTDVVDILDGSCMQIKIHSTNMLRQLFARSDTEATVMAQGALLNSYAARLTEECMNNLEHVFTSYWGGIATVIHSGLFDFVPPEGDPLARMLAELQAEPSEQRKGKQNSEDPSGRQSTTDSFALSHVSDHGASRVDNVDEGEEKVSILPTLKFIPVVPKSLSKDGTPLTLRDLSVNVVRRMIRSASEVMNSLFLTFVNRSVLLGFVNNIAVFTNAEKKLHASSERLELYASILVEVIMGQWERMMLMVGDSILRIKVAVGESCSANSIQSDKQIEEIGELLEELEVLRSSCYRCYLHGIGMLSKAYITSMPFIVENGKTTLELRIRPRLGREFVSSILPTKLLNLLSVVLDRSVHFLRRDAEIFDSADLFAAKEDEDETKEVDSRRKSEATRRRLLRRRRGSTKYESQTDADVQDEGMPPPVAREDKVDRITLFVAECHSKLVLDHVAEQEELIQALVANLLLTFIDMLHLKSQSACGNITASPEEQSRDIVESMADTLCIPTALIPILLDNLLRPCLFDICGQLFSQHSSDQKCAAFSSNYLSRVYEHSQLVIDAMMSIYLAIPQSSITLEVRRNGFTVPLQDWQRATSHTLTSIRPYLSECLAYIASANEVMNWIHQPILGAAVTQKLIGHLATVFMTSISSNFNAFEISPDCSVDFLTHGLLIIESEARVIAGVIEKIIEDISRNPKSGDVLPELQVTLSTLQSLAMTIQKEGVMTCEMYAAQSDVAVLSADARNKRRDQIVATSMEEVQYMVSAISTQLDETALPSSLPQVSGVVNSIAERLAKRSEGYQVRHQAKHTPETKTSTEKKRRKKVFAAKVPTTSGGEESPPLPATPRKDEGQQQKVVAAALLKKETGEAAPPKKTIHRRRRVEREEEAAEAPPEETPEPLPPAPVERTATQEGHRPNRLAARAQARREEHERKQRELLEQPVKTQETAAPIARGPRRQRAAAAADGETAAPRRARRERQFGRATLQ